MDEFQTQLLAVLERIAVAVEGIREDAHYEWVDAEEGEEE